MAGYLVKELFGPTLRGEGAGGARAGRWCVSRAVAARRVPCPWCDPAFTPGGGGGRGADELAARLVAPDANAGGLGVVPGGERALRGAPPLALALRDAG